MSVRAVLIDFCSWVTVGPLRQTEGVFGACEPVAEQQGFVDKLGGLSRLQFISPEGQWLDL